jgi:hypothetical protein
MNNATTITCLVSSLKPFHVIQASPEFAECFGYTAEEMNGRSLNFLQRPCCTLSFESLIKTQQQKQFLLDVCSKEGRPFTIRASGSKKLEGDTSSIATVQIQIPNPNFTSSNQMDERNVGLQDKHVEDLNADILSHHYLVTDTKQSVGLDLKTKQEEYQDLKTKQEEYQFTPNEDKHVIHVTTTTTFADELRGVLSHASCRVRPFTLILSAHLEFAD